MFCYHPTVNKMFYFTSASAMNRRVEAIVRAAETNVFCPSFCPCLVIGQPAASSLTSTDVMAAINYASRD